MTTLPPYKPEDHRVSDSGPPLWKSTLLVFIVFVVVPLAACLVVAVVAEHLLLLFLAVIGGFGGLVYGIRNMDRLEWLDDEDDFE